MTMMTMKKHFLGKYNVYKNANIYPVSKSTIGIKRLRFTVMIQS